MHANYIKEMTEAADAIIRRNNLFAKWKDRAEVISEAKATRDQKILNEIFDAFIKDEESVDLEIYSAIRDNPSTDAHLAEEIALCHAKLAQPSLEELDEMERPIA